MTIAEGEKALARPRTKNKKALLRVEDMALEEILAFCPGCKTLEVIRFGSEGLIATRQFSARADKVYHSCGSPDACRLHGPADRTGADTTCEVNGVSLSSQVSGRSVIHSRQGRGVVQ